MMADLLPTLPVAAVAAYALALLSAVSGFGGGVLLLPVFTALFGLRVAVPVLTLAQISSSAGRAWFNRRDLQWRLIGRFSIGAVPFAVGGALLLATAPLAPLQRLLGAFLLVTVVWRRLRPAPRPLGDGAFVAVGAGSGLGSALLGSVGPLTAPFFLARGLRRAAYIGTEAACALVMHLTKAAAYGAATLIDGRVLLLGAALTPATPRRRLHGQADRRPDQRPLFVVLVEATLAVAGVLFLLGI